MTICKPRHWNLGIGIGIGTDTRSTISSIRPMDTKPSRLTSRPIDTKPSRLTSRPMDTKPSSRLRMRGPHPQSHVTLQYRGHEAYEPQT